jgi:hypothetical protein
MQIRHNAVGAFTLASVLALGLLAATPAAATKGGKDVLIVYDFDGLCTDCSAAAGVSEDGMGVLTLKNVTDISDVTAQNFVSFNYTSNLVTLDLTSVLSLSANFTVPATAYVSLTAATGDPRIAGSAIWSLVTDSSSGQSWTLTKVGDGGPQGAGNGVFDYGAAYSWTSASVPEPVSWALMIVGFGLAGAQVRLQRRQDRRSRLAA